MRRETGPQALKSLASTVELSKHIRLSYWIEKAGGYNRRNSKGLYRYAAQIGRTMWRF